jgi:hypothetical protein
MKVTTDRIKGQTPDVGKADLPKIYLRNHSTLKARTRVGLKAHDPGPSAIQDKEMATGRIDCHPLRVLKIKVPGIVADKGRWVQIACRPLPYLNQSVGSRL